MISLLDGDTSQAYLAGVTAQLGNVLMKLDEFLPPKTQIYLVLQLHVKIGDLLNLKTRFQELKLNVSEMKESVNFNSAQYDELLADYNIYKKGTNKLKSEVFKLTIVLYENTARTEQLQVNQNEPEWYKRLFNQEIHGMVVSPADLQKHCRRYRH